LPGAALGGSYGWLGGCFGLACDNLVAAEVMIADGRQLALGPDENPDPKPLVEAGNDARSARCWTAWCSIR